MTGAERLERYARDLVGQALDAASRVVAFGYDLAKISRRTADWNRPATSANSETYEAGEVPADSAHDLVRNNPVARRARQIVTSKMIGRGFVPVADPRWLALFNAWAPHCYTRNRSNFARVQTMAIEAMIESGEVLIRRRWRRVEDVGWDGLPLALPFQLEMIEAAQIDRLKDGPAPLGGRYEQGIEYNAFGRPVAIWIYQEHPGDRWQASGSYQSVAVPYEDLVHLFREDRPGQSRGVTWYLATGSQIRRLSVYESNEQERKKLEACTVAYIYNENADPATDTQGRLIAPAVQDSTGAIIEKPAPGQHVYVPAGYKVERQTPTPTQGYGEFMDQGDMRVAQGWGVPFYTLKGDYSKVNYSASRIGNVETYAWVSPEQEQIIVPMFLDVVARWCTEAALAKPRGLRGTIADWPVEWDAPAVEEANRSEAVDADEREIRAGFTTRARVVRARGWDPKKTLQERADEVAEEERLGVKLDSNPNVTTRSGAIQPADPSTR